MSLRPLMSKAPSPQERRQTAQIALKAWRDSLIDLTGRNRLLNFRKTKTGTLKIAEPGSQEVINRLLTGRNLSFVALLEPAAGDEPDNLLPELDESRLELVTTSDELDVSARQHVLDGPHLLGAQSEPGHMGAVLRQLQSRTQQAFLDTGLWTLFLAVGSINWADPQDKSKKYNSPLLLVPVELMRQAKAKVVELRHMSDDTVLNPALQLILADFNVQLPDFTEDDLADIAAYMGRVEKAVNRYPDWRVKEDVHLSYFTFHKEAMYRDLLDNEEQVLESEHIIAIATSGIPGQTQDFLFDPVPSEAVDEFDPPEKSRLVLDADASQRAAIIAALDGRSFVLDGPPGTGKSQTIANIIASLIGANRTVLFVSEKAAALEVVKNRLEDVGLSHAVLELHSHKATRKEVSSTLSEAVTTRPTAQGRISDADRRRLGQVRKQLTRHASEMNVQRMPMGLSLHDAIGRVSLLEKFTATPRCTGDLKDLDADRFAHLLSIARELQRAWPAVVQGTESPWYGVLSTKPLAVESQRVIEALDDLSAAFAPYSQLAQELGWDQPGNSERLANLVDHWGRKDPGLPLPWVTEADATPLYEAAEEVAEALDHESTESANSHQVCGENFAELAITANAFDPESSFVEAENAGAARSVLLACDGTQLRTHQSKLQQASLGAAQLADVSASLAKALGSMPPRTIGELEDLLTVENVARAVERPEASWITAEVNPRVADAIASLRAAVSEDAQAAAQATEFFDVGILECDPKALQIRFANIHRGMRKLGGAYRADLKTLAEASQPGIRAKDNVPHLGLAVTWRDARNRLVEMESQYAELLGSRYQGTETDWDGLNKSLQNARLVAERARPESIERLSAAIGYGTPPNPQTRNQADTLRACLLEIEAVNDLFDGSAGNQDEDLLVLGANLASAIKAVNDLLAFVSATDAVLGRGHDVQSAIDSLEAARSWQRSRKALEEAAADHRQVLGDLYEGLDTNPDRLLDAIEWTRQLRDQLKHSVQADTACLTAGAVEELSALRFETQVLRSSHLRWLKAIEDLLGAFDSDRHMQLQLDLNDWAEGRTLAEFFGQDIAGQAQYFSGREADEMLAQDGLEDVISTLMDKDAPQDHIAACLERELLRRWIDLVLDDDDQLRKVGSQSRDSLVQDFQELDRQMIATAVADIVDQTNAERPTIGIGQSQILVSQGQKKRNLLPIRNLISSTWDVTTRLKPVFMMSPLSVSQFLDPEQRFDVVIFDEASQVLPEDAVNAIYRGRQLIIAGDDKQLPPTTFFALMDGDGSLDDLEVDAKDFESILDLAKGCTAYPSLTLQWHYRSRHEDLITFSNRRFYGGKLITFPSSQQEGERVGVKFFHVEDGVYGRGGSQRNMPEARFVASRVEHHFDQRPGMSLGVVTFSQKQAEAVEAAVYEMFDRRPDLLEGLDTSRLEGFFIKNLESVQGDERDVMIFSIGYGPDADGKLTMTFGPVTGKGGGRRLNVAVTRARFRNEIVASFQPGQMRPGSSEGLRHLATYLDYAERGPSALALDGVESQGPPESPFEESVIEWLESKGWDVVPQVGASGYKIDMAIRDPRMPGRFLLGIECDGRQYHSSQTARDRDRLRQEVLEGLGWTLHRIWGPSWYRQRKHEQDRIEQALERALEADPVGRLGSGPRPTARRAQVELEEIDLEALPDWVRPYRRAYPSKPPRGADPSTSSTVHYLKKTIEEVVKVESPVHQTVVEARIRETWGIGRIGPQIRQQISAATDIAGVSQGESFLFVGDLSQELPTRQHDAETRREIHQIHDRELQDTVWRVVRDATSARADDAFLSRCARYLGIQRVGTDVRAALERAILDLINQGFLDQGLDGDLRLMTPEAD